MKKKWLILVAAGLSLVLLGVILKTKVFNRKGPGALQVIASPKSVVYIDNAQAGSTPFFNDKIQPGEHTVKLVPEGDSNAAPWETKITLDSGIVAVINRILAETDSASSGEILTLEKIANRDKSELSVVSVPDGAVIKVEGEPKGFSPISLSDLTPGDYEVIISSPGYEERIVSAKLVAGYRLIVDVQLARKIEGIEEATPSGQEGATPTAAPTGKLSPTPTLKANTTPTTEIAKPYVKVKDTPTGFLRVRVLPSTSATEAAQIKPGETYPYLNEEENGWYKIEYEESKEGWVSGVYVDLVK